jgi:DNA-binding transcriptional ArsR family regulator
MSTAAALPATDADRIFIAMGDGTRRAIFRLLSEGPQSVSALAKALKITLTAVAQHLDVLQSCRLVQTRKVGRVRECAIDRQGLDVLDEWIALNKRMWDARLDRLGAVLDDPAQIQTLR